MVLSLNSQPYPYMRRVKRSHSYLSLSFRTVRRTGALLHREQGLHKCLALAAELGYRMDVQGTLPRVSLLRSLVDVIVLIIRGRSLEGWRIPKQSTWLIKRWGRKIEGKRSTPQARPFIHPHSKSFCYETQGVRASSESLHPHSPLYKIPTQFCVGLIIGSLPDSPLGLLLFSLLFIIHIK